MITNEMFRPGLALIQRYPYKIPLVGTLKIDICGCRLYKALTPAAHLVRDVNIPFDQRR